MHYDELRKAREELTGPGGDFEIVEADVLGNRLRVYKNAPVSVREVWLSTAQFADRTYLIYQDERLTYAESHRIVNAVAAWLADQGVKPGDRVDGGKIAAIGDSSLSYVKSGRNRVLKVPN